jgi:MFS family permease
MVRKLLLFVCAVGFLDTVFYAALTPLLPRLVDAFALSKPQAGLLTGAYALGAGVGALPAGLLALGRGVRAVVVAGLATVAASTALFGLADRLWLLDLARFAQGLGDAFAWTGALAWLIFVAPRERRGELIGMAIAAAIVGSLLGPVLGSSAALLGRAATFSAVALLALVLLAWALVIPGASTRSEQATGALGRALAQPAIRAGAWFVTVGTLLSGTVSVLVPLHFDRLDWGSARIGAVFLVAAAISAAVAPLLGRWSDRRGRRKPLQVGLASSAAMACLLPWPQQAWLLAPVVVACSIAVGFILVPAMALLTDGAEAAGLAQALAVSLFTLTWAPGQAIGSTIGGTLAGATTDAIPYLLLAACAALTTGYLHHSAAFAASSQTRPTTIG